MFIRMPQSGMVERGARVYAANGCIYCHSQQVRADYAADDIERKWGDRRSAPRDYIFERPVFLGKMRMGQDFANIGARAPAEQESPPPVGAATPAASPAQPADARARTESCSARRDRPESAPPAKVASPAPAAPPSRRASLAFACAKAPAPGPSSSPASAISSSGGKCKSGRISQARHEERRGLCRRAANRRCTPPPGIMCIFIRRAVSTSIRTCRPIVFFIRTRRISDARSADALQAYRLRRATEGWEIVPTFDAKCLVAYLMSLNQSHP